MEWKILKSIFAFSVASRLYFLNKVSQQERGHVEARSVTVRGGDSSHTRIYGQHSTVMKGRRLVKHSTCRAILSTRIYRGRRQIWKKKRQEQHVNGDVLRKEKQWDLIPW